MRFLLCVTRTRLWIPVAFCVIQKYTIQYHMRERECVRDKSLLPSMHVEQTCPYAYIFIYICACIFQRQNSYMLVCLSVCLFISLLLPSSTHCSEILVAITALHTLIKRWDALIPFTKGWFQVWKAFVLAYTLIPKYWAGLIFWVFGRIEICFGWHNIFEVSKILESLITVLYLILIT